MSPYIKTTTNRVKVASPCKSFSGKGEHYFMFKELTTKFEVKREKLGYHYLFEIKRKESGAFAYGDHSCCLFDIYDMGKNNEHIRDDFFDTRYDHLKTDKESWVKMWRDYIKENWREVSEIVLISHSENMVEEMKRG